MCLKRPRRFKVGFSGKHPAPYERALARVLHIGARTGTLTWRRLASHPTTRLVQTITFNAIQLLKPTVADFAAFLAAARNLAIVRNVPHALADELKPAWQQTFRAQPSYDAYDTQVELVRVP
jgi:hypothetical protein